MRIYDITLPMQDSLAPWPGDTPYHFELHGKRSEGAPVNVGAVTMSVHTGTHADAPFHFQDSGETIDAVDLGSFLGAAVVLDVSGRESIGREDVEPVDLAPRVLFRTNAWTDPARFPAAIPVMDQGVARYLKERGVVLVGVDVPSVDRLDSKDLPIHHELAACGIHILESLYLAQVPAGKYELVALPLKLVGADGAPVRAILRSKPGV